MNIKKNDGNRFTTVSVSKEIKQLIDKCGHKGETYNDILERLAQSYLKRKT